MLISFWAWLAMWWLVEWISLKSNKIWFIPAAPFILGTTWTKSPSGYGVSLIFDALSFSMPNLVWHHLCWPLDSHQMEFYPLDRVGTPNGTLRHFRKTLGIKYALKSPSVRRHIFKLIFNIYPHVMRYCWEAWDEWNGHEMSIGWARHMWISIHMPLINRWHAQGQRHSIPISSFLQPLHYCPNSFLPCHVKTSSS